MIFKRKTKDIFLLEYQANAVGHLVISKMIGRKIRG